jgi:hypothetical protein
VSIERCDRHDEEFDTDHRCECVYCEQEAAEREDSAWHEAERNEILDGQAKDRKMGMDR